MSPRLLVALLAGSLVAGAVATLLAAPAVRAAGPTITITDPAPGTTIVAGSRFRLGWKEKPSATSLPITKRTVRQYVATTTSCGSGSYALAWTNSTANRPFRYPLSNLAAGRCYYWRITLTDISGASVTARTGYVKRLAATDPWVEVSFPVPGAFTDAPPVGAFTVKWSEVMAEGVKERTVVEESAPVASGRTCIGVSWSVGQTYTPGSASVTLEGLSPSTCYRYTVTIHGKAGVTASATSGPLLITDTPPPCAYGDVYTTERSYDDWQISLMDPTYRVSSSYVPPDLVYTSGISYMSGSYRIRSLAKSDLKAMAGAARAAGATIDIASAYRSYSTQSSTFSSWVSKSGMYRALLRSARPGHSEHQLGTTIDFKSYGGSAGWNYTDWATTKAGAWMAANAWKYGWLMSYPKNASPAITCYRYEPWHYRYYGRSLAKAIHDSDLTTREWLWRHGSLAPGA